MNPANHASGSSFRAGTRRRSSERRFERFARIWNPTSFPYEGVIIVVDDGSTDDTFE